MPLIAAAALLLAACSPGGQQAATATPAAKPAASPAVASPAASPAASPSPAAVPSPAVASPAASPAASPSPAAAVRAPTGAAVTIAAPAPDSTVPAGDVRVTYDVTGITLVPAAQATKLDDLHAHVLCDVDPGPYLGTTTPIPVNRPDIIHTADKEVTCPAMTAGQRRITVIITSSNHVSVDPSVSASVGFTVR
jgi:hypothetical protein